MRDLKVRLAKALCDPRVGSCVDLLLNGVVYHRGCLIDTRHESITMETKASLMWGFYEAAETRFVKRYLPRNLDVVELGTSIGVVSAHIARRLGPGQKLICVEANPALLNQIKKNVQRNGPGIALIVENAAISGGHSSHVQFSIAPENTNSTLATKRNVWPTARVRRISLGILLRKYQIRKYSLVSDIEGAERFILDNDAAALEDCQLIIIELHEITTENGQVLVEGMVNQIEHLGFNLRDRRGPG